jgi:hypothetical protein
MRVYMDSLRTLDRLFTGRGSTLASAADEDRIMTVGMVVLGLVAFVAMFGFIALCDRV